VGTVFVLDRHGLDIFSLLRGCPASLISLLNGYGDFAIAAAIIMFLIPVRAADRVLSDGWETPRDMPWWCFCCCYGGGYGGWLQ